MKAIRLNQIIIFLSCVGVFIAGLLTFGHYADMDLPCGVAKECEKVTSSEWSELFGVPIAVFGLLGYLTFLGAAVYRLLAGFRQTFFWTKVSFGLSAFGTLTSLILTLYSITTLNAMCMWCIGSAFTMFFLFVTHYLLFTSEQPDQKGFSMPDTAVLSVCVLIAATGLFVGPKTFMKSASQVRVIAASKRDIILGKQTHVMGNKDSNVILVEFVDLSCPTCRRSFGKLKDLAEEYPKLKIVVRHYPFTNMEGHELSLSAAFVSELASEQGRFWDYMDIIMNPAQKLAAKEQITEAAGLVGLNKDRVAKAIVGDDDPSLSAVQADLADGEQLGLVATPTYFLMAPDENILVMSGGDLEPTLNSPKWQAILKGK